MNSENINLLYIDLFCGAGGTSTGVESALANAEKCAKVIACVNHDANAIASHATNHPDALHFTEDIRTLDLTLLLEHARKMLARYPGALLVLWASLECTNFSKAKGGQSRDADSRTLAEHLYRYIEAFIAAGIPFNYIQIENVEEFMSWGDLDENGRPISMDKGRLYRKWVRKVKKYGYKHKHRILNAADFGAFTSRKRYFGQFAQLGLPIIWPEPTHEKRCENIAEKIKRNSHEKKLIIGEYQKRKPWKAVREVLDLCDEGKSIFNRRKPLSEKTLERIYAGLIKFVAGGKDKFLIKWNSMHRTGHYNAPSVDEPCPVVTTQNRLGVASVNFLSKYFSGHPDSKNISLDGPAHTIKTKDNHALITSNFISAYYGNGDNVSDIDSPAPTVTTKDRLSLVSPKFIDQQYGQSKPSSIEQPLGSITTTPKYALVHCRPWLMDTNFNNVGSSIDNPAPVITANRKWHYLLNPQYNNNCNSVDKPCFTLIARMDKKPPYLVVTETGEVAIEVYDSDSPMTKKIKEFMAMYGIVDIKMRMLKIPELKRIMGFPVDYTLVGTKADQKKYIGNAVEVNMAKALCSALATRLRESSEIKMAI